MGYYSPPNHFDSPLPTYYSYAHVHTTHAVKEFPYISIHRVASETKVARYNNKTLANFLRYVTFFFLTWFGLVSLNYIRFVMSDHELAQYLQTHP